MTHYRSIIKCRLCGANHLQDVFSLGQQPLTGIFKKPNEPEPIKAPLEIVACLDCKFLQLKHTIDPSLMFFEHWYRSGINQTMRDHLAAVVRDITHSIKLTAGDCVVDIGCNDGTLLSHYDTPGLVKVGVDPSDVIHSIKDRSVFKVNTYFSTSALRTVIGKKKAKIISSISMFYHLDNPHTFIEDIKQCLDQDGVWVVEMNYTGNMVLGLGYDMISHEHVGYYTLLSFERLLQIHGMHVNDAKFDSINGGSIRLICSIKQSISATVLKIRDEEKKSGLEDIQSYEKFILRVNNFRDRLRSLILGLIENGKTIAAYGASTRGNTILQHCEFTSKEIFAAADRNPGKWGLITPGSRIPILSEESVRNLKPDYMLILPYDFLEEFLKREEEYLQSGGKIIVPLPELCIFSWKNGMLVKEIV